LRPVTGYPGGHDGNPRAASAENDGIFIVDIESGKKRLLVSLRQLADLIAARMPDVEGTPLFINHTLWNRDDDRIYFYLRGNFDRREASTCRAPSGRTGWA
jgi:hypothetical protein